MSTSLMAQHESISIIPKPVELTLGNGVFEISANTVIVTDTSHPDLVHIANFLAKMIVNPTTWNLPIVDVADFDQTAGQNVIQLSLDGDALERKVFDPTIHPTIAGSDYPEHYSLDVSPNKVQISAAHPAAIFYGIQTLRQLLPPEFDYEDYSRVPASVTWQIPAVTIRDEPRFAYRGMHLDVGRHFMPVEFVKTYIDMLAMHKMNTFHWHLTEDQGWRIEILNYPKLIEIGAWRDSTLIGHYNSSRYDNIRYGGFYTQDEIREVVAYAHERFIHVIPEIELPGHASAALAAYPEFGCTDLNHQYKVQSTWGIFEEIFCPTEETFQFLKDVFTEVMELFPGTFIHIGGDEAMKNQWQASSIAQEVMHREGLADEHELQSYFIRRMDSFLEENGRRLLGWDEILEGGLAPGATVMSWRGEAGGIAAARMGHDAVMSPTGYAYLDYYQADRSLEPLAIGGFLPLEKVYSYDPIPADLEADLHHHILGAQANVWTEYMKTPEKVMYMAYPRAFAMAEVVWSTQSERSFQDFKSRLTQHLKRLDVMGIGYRPLDD
jgi:hexosaminidase